MSLTSLASTLEAYRNSESKTFVSDLIPVESRGIITNPTEHPDVIARLLVTGIKEDDVLEYNDIVDLKMILILLSRLLHVDDFDKEHNHLQKLYELAYSA